MITLVVVVDLQNQSSSYIRALEEVTADSKQLGSKKLTQFLPIGPKLLPMSHHVEGEENIGGSR